jgi:hypothetical protein
LIGSQIGELEVNADAKYIFYICSILWYNPNTNTKLEPKFWAHANEALWYTKYGQNTTVFWRVQVWNRFSLGQYVSWRFQNRTEAMV